MTPVLKHSLSMFKAPRLICMQYDSTKVWSKPGLVLPAAVLAAQKALLRPELRACLGNIERPCAP